VKLRYRRLLLTILWYSFCEQPKENAVRLTALLEEFEADEILWRCVVEREKEVGH